MALPELGAGAAVVGGLVLLGEEAGGAVDGVVVEGPVVDVGSEGLVVDGDGCRPAPDGAPRRARGSDVE